jgi:succinate-semialdehyde dehydrogenase / glutarate-semialdehyde dehydrogenase
MMKSVSPATGQLLAEYAEHSSEEIHQILERAVKAQSGWRELPVDQRVVSLRKAAEILCSGADGFARIMALEMGKPVSAGRAEAEKCAWVCEYYAGNAQRFLADEEIPTDASRSIVSFKPLGLVLAVMPWNFPFWQVFRCAAPALAAGNGIILKHASNVSGCALEIERIFAAAGFPKGLFASVLLPGARVEELIADRRIAGVALTGSSEAGRSVAACAGRHLRKTVLELGGSDPYVILEDADTDLAAEACVTGRMINAGQSCIAAKRLIVVDSVREAFTEKLLNALSAYHPGDPLDPAVNLGPLARADLRDDLHSQVERSVAMGAKLLMGGRIPESPGFYYPPTALDDVRPGMPAFDEETFGPLAVIIPARDTREALELANRSPFGLGAAVFTRDTAGGEQIARNLINAGSCFVNSFVKSDPRLPFGGIGDSGWGRELARQGILEFVNVKTIWVR